MSIDPAFMIIKSGSKPSRSRSYILYFALSTIDPTYCTLHLVQLIRYNFTPNDVVNETTGNGEQDLVSFGYKELEVQIEDFISNIRQRVTDRDKSRRPVQVEIEDLEPDENNAGVNPLPVDCPLLLVDLTKVNSSDMDSLIRECKGDRVLPSVECYREGSRSRAETSEIGSKETESRRTEDISVAPEDRREQSTCTSAFKTGGNWKVEDINDYLWVWNKRLF